MATREQIRPTPVLDSTTGQSMAGNLTSKVTQVPGISLLSYDVSWVGVAPVGTLSVEGSNTALFDATGHYTANSGNWNTIPFENSSGTIVTSVAVAGATGHVLIGLGQIPFEYIRLVYTRTGGTGTLTAIVAGKVS